MPAGETDEEVAKRLFGDEGNITEYIVELGFGVRNTTKAEVDAMHRGAVRRGGAARRGGGPRAAVRRFCARLRRAARRRAG